MKSIFFSIYILATTAVPLPVIKTYEVKHVDPNANHSPATVDDKQSNSVPSRYYSEDSNSESDSDLDCDDDSDDQDEHDRTHINYSVPLNGHRNLTDSQHYK
jgi:hypothetical protein